MLAKVAEFRWKVQLIQDQFVKALQIHLSQFEDGPRLSEIFSWSLTSFFC
jgi:hypothetical protein